MGSAPSQSIEHFGKTYIEYMPGSNRFFHVDEVGFIDEYVKPHTQHSISHRIAALHGFSKESWERQANENRRF